jgi:predicted Zn-dependent protease with MMP-like domain
VTFEDHVRGALDALPPHLAKALENVAVVVEEQDPNDPDLYGVWQSHEFMPDKITIFRRPLVESFPDSDELEREIRITVLHELGHYFGLDEDQIEKLGYE